MTISGATTSGQSGPGSGGNEGVLHNPQGSSITGASQSDYLISYPGHSLGVSYPSACYILNLCWQYVSFGFLNRI